MSQRGSATTPQFLMVDQNCWIVMCHGRSWIQPLYPNIVVVSPIKQRNHRIPLPYQSKNAGSGCFYGTCSGIATATLAIRCHSTVPSIKPFKWAKPLTWRCFGGWESFRFSSQMPIPSKSNSNSHCFHTLFYYCRPMPDAFLKQDRCSMTWPHKWTRRKPFKFLLSPINCNPQFALFPTEGSP